MICGLFLLKTRRFPILSSSGRRFTSIHHIKKEEEDTCLRPSVIPQKAGRMLRICRILRTNRKHPSCLCDPAGIQTQDLQNRNLTLYSAKLPGQCGCKNTEKERIPKEKCRKIHTTAPRNGVFRLRQGEKRAPDIVPPSVRSPRRLTTYLFPLPECRTRMHVFAPGTGRKATKHRGGYPVFHVFFIPLPQTMPMHSGTDSHEKHIIFGV